MQTRFSLRSLLMIIAAAITIWLVFSEGTLTALLVAGLFFFSGSLIEIFQQREVLDRRRLITLTVVYTLALVLILVGIAWRYRAMFMG